MYASELFLRKEERFFFCLQRLEGHRYTWGPYKPIARTMTFVSVLDIFSIGIGPSSSHTVGPMRAARRFLVELKEREFLEEVCRVQVELFGSLAMTGKGHATDVALLLGLEGSLPESVEPDEVPQRIMRIEETGRISLFGRLSIPFSSDTDILFLKGKRLPFHSNALRFTAYGLRRKKMHSTLYYSVGGGFVIDHAEAMRGASPVSGESVAFPFRTAEELVGLCRVHGMEIWELMLANEGTRRSEKEVRYALLHIWHVMKQSVARGIATQGILPGGLEVPRRASRLFTELQESGDTFAENPALFMEWVSLYALAVNEENAAGGRVVTAPTNGSAGVIPAVLHYCQKFVAGFSEDQVIIFLLTAAAIAMLYKEGASLSAAEMGCQGEIGVSSSMAAAGLAAVLGGSVEQIENAAEIAMEHHLGMTCDPVGGLVQIPCIERNTMGALKAINAALLALRGDGKHSVSLDAVIRAMKETGENMKHIYKETSEGGLALQVSVGIPTC